MRIGRKRLAIGLLAAAVLAVGVLVFGLRQMLIGDGDEVSPWLYCTTSPCRPLALFPVPTPPALTPDSFLAASCDYSGSGAGDGILLWHTDWDPLTDEGICVSRAEAGRLGAR